MCVPPVEPYLKEVKNVLLVGIEAHVCVLQTTYDLLEKGLNVHVVVDAVSSRSLTDRSVFPLFTRVSSLAPPCSPLCLAAQFGVKSLDG